MTNNGGLIKHICQLYERNNKFQYLKGGNSRYNFLENTSADEK